MATTDSSIRQQINELIAQEHQLREALGRGEITEEAEHARLTELETHLDQLWDLLRQRQARRDAGLNPDDSQERSANTVEHYLN